MTRDAPASRPLADLPLLRRHGFDVAGGHRLHVEEFGHADGLPALVLHGGPGSGCSPVLRRGFDPARWRVICVDQRGAGQSEPAGCTADNTTAHLLADLRLLRERLGVSRWLVVGGSWGASLAIAHAADTPDAVSGLLLRASFAARAEDIAWFFQGGRSVCPDAWEALAALVPPAARGDLLGHLAQTLAGADEAARARAAIGWWRYEQAVAGGSAVPASPTGPALAALLARYRVQSHYLRHGCWLARPSLIDRCAALPPVPTLLLHGRADRVCRPEGAMALHAALPHSRLEWVDDAGHDPTHPAMAAAIRRALDGFAAVLAR